MTCPDCKGTGRIVLLTSDVECEKCKKEEEPDYKDIVVKYNMRNVRLQTKELMKVIEEALGIDNKKPLYIS